MCVPTVAYKLNVGPALPRTRSNVTSLAFLPQLCCSGYPSLFSVYFHMACKLLYACALFALGRAQRAPYIYSILRVLSVCLYISLVRLFRPRGPTYYPSARVKSHHFSQTWIKPSREWKLNRRLPREHVPHRLSSGKSRGISEKREEH